MITFSFTVRADQGEPNQFDLGDMTVHGDQGTVTSEGRTPDQGMMIYVAVADLLYQIRRTLDARRGTFEFVGTDSSFRLLFRTGGGNVTVRTSKETLATVPARELLSAALAAADVFARTWLPALDPTDAARIDLESELRNCTEALGR